MSTTNVPRKKDGAFSRQKDTMKTFYHLLIDMRNQRVGAIALAIGQAAFAHSVLFLICLGLIHARQISGVLLVDRLDQKQREEFYETPKIHGISTNDIRFMEADRLVNFTLILLYGATAISLTYALSTLGLLIGVIKRRCELILPWIIFQSILCAFYGMILLLALANPKDFVIEYTGVSFFYEWLFAVVVLFVNLICLLVVIRYYKGLKMLKRLTEEVVIPIPYRVVPFHFRKENMHVGSGGYKHLLSDSNPCYVV